uniref:C-CAP/cofactor C-like domain-containing protein n=1 Tax=Ananas comosus var. bracteatus TaxID=296719 RepID=A0A6V7Q6Y8_ANACO|nr:unnamed protein product [Ananas comosus var. bracteatus]
MRACASGRAGLARASGREQGQAGERVLGRQRGGAGRRGRAPARTGDASWRGRAGANGRIFYFDKRPSKKLMGRPQRMSRMQEIYGAAGYFNEPDGSNTRKHSNSVKLPEVSVSNKLEGFRAKQEVINLINEFYLAVARSLSSTMIAYGNDNCLRKVTDDMKSKNRSDKAGVVSASEKETVSGCSSISKRSTPKFELQMGRKWAVENQVGEKNLVIDDCDAKQSVYVYGCKDSVLQVKGKVNNITIDKCTKMGILFKDVVAACEIVNCNSVEVQCEGSAPTISIDNTSGCQLYLGKDSLETSITTAKSSEVNVLVTGAGPDGDWIVNWRNHLKFPENAKLSPEAKDLISRLLCNVEQRLGTKGAHEIKAHPWFNGTQWDKLYQMEAAFKPEVTGELDTQNFEKFEETAAPMQTSSKSGPWRKMLSSKDTDRRA